MIYSLYGGGGKIMLVLMLFGIWMLMMAVICYLGARLLLDSKYTKHPKGSKIIAMLDFCMTGIGIVMFGTLMTDDWPVFIVEAVIIYVLLGSGMMVLSSIMLRKPDNLANLCECTHSMKVHSTNGSECSICMCRYFQGNSND